MAKKPKIASNTIALNKKARFDYFIEDEIEAGLSLQGWELKAIRAGKVNLSEGYIIFKDNEAYLFGSTITPLVATSTHIVADPLRTRKLLLSRKEINYIFGKSNQAGLTIVPLSMYWKNSWVKLKIGVAKGKKEYDKRETIKDREWAKTKERMFKTNIR